MGLFENLVWQAIKSVSESAIVEHSAGSRWKMGELVIQVTQRIARAWKQLWRVARLAYNHMGHRQASAE